MMNEDRVWLELVGGAVRHVLTKLSGVLVMHGYMVERDTEQLVGAGLFLLGLVWSWARKWRRAAGSGAAGSGPGGAGRALSLAAGLLAAGWVCGCAHLAPGADPVVVNAERAVEAAVEAFDGFLAWELANREAAARVPAIRVAADVIRREGVGWLERARSATRAYKAARTAAARAEVAAAVSDLEYEVARAAALKGGGL